MSYTQQDITGPVARQIREAAGLSQRKFWEPIGVLQSVASKYEDGSHRIPRPVRMLIVARYVAGLQIDANTADGVKALGRLGNLQAKDRDIQAKDLAVQASAARARNALSQAVTEIQAAQESINTL